MRPLKMLKTEENSTILSEKQPQIMDDPKQYEKDLLQTIESKEQHILYSLERVKAYILKEYRLKKEKALKDMQQFEKINDKEAARALAIHIGLPFTDYAKHLQEKLCNVMHTKQFYLNVNTELGKVVKLDEKELSIAKDNFDMVCNYQKRRENGIPSEDLYTPELMKYLIQRTFKKSANDAYAAISSINLEGLVDFQKEYIRICCIGGGPGSDLTGILCYLMELGHFKFECFIYDYNHTNWENVAAKPLLEILKAQSKKSFGKEIEISIKWVFCDIKSDWDDKTPIPSADIFCSCWALNESIYYPKFWEDLIDANKNALFFLIDGDRYPIENFRYFKSLSHRKFLYEGLETPRRLTIFPVSTIDL